ncbi:MAG: peptide chain release factor N(5)-glutamine methyltransferase [Bacteroidaceae bacterium]|nr:peptide chain release factor N(5)-glutamine methyltransferase [Bacteroidaceae bacterium]
MVNEELQLLQQRYGAGEARALYELVMQRRFGLSRTDILLGKDTNLSADDQAELQIIIHRMAKGEPVQYVLGAEEFCGREFLVGPGVLIPRPETQELVRLVRQHVAPASSILDVGTGSGCIAITLALDGYQVTALDISDEALSYARRNAERLGAALEFVKEDILSNSKSTIQNSKLRAAANSSFLDASAPRRTDKVRSFILHSPFHCIVSNPPYVCEREAAEMDENVLLHEPRLALFVPDDDPLVFYRAIADYGLRHLAADGWLFFEANRAHARHVAELLRQKGYRDIETVKDQYDNDRFVVGRL